jgi:hypothetical protein
LRPPLGGAPHVVMHEMIELTDQKLIKGFYRASDRSRLMGDPVRSKAIRWDAGIRALAFF